MFFSRALFSNFRNIQSLDVKLDQGFVVLTGANGAGKTNFLEGLYFGSLLKKFPETKLRNLFFRGSNFFRLQLDIQDHDTASSLEVVAREEGDKFLMKTKNNNQEITRVKYQSNIPVVSFLPQDLSLLSRSPNGRRHYLDETLSLVSPEYRLALSNFSRVLRQRNELYQKIHNREADISELTVWNDQLVAFGSLVTGMRQLFMRYLNSRITEVLGFISPKLVDITFIYRHSAPIEQTEYGRQLEDVRELELKRSITLLGPHRDDFYAALEGENAVGLLSRGQLRAITLAMKILERQYIEKIHGQPPIMLLDDVFSEFDEQHQRLLIDFLHSCKQVFLTTAHLSEVRDFLPAVRQIFAVESGKISPL